MGEGDPFFVHWNSKKVYLQVIETKPILGLGPLLRGLFCQLQRASSMASTGTPKTASEFLYTFFDLGQEQGRDLDRMQWQAG